MALRAKGLIFLWIIGVLLLLGTCKTLPSGVGELPLTYARDVLLSLRYIGADSPADLPEAVRIQPSDWERKRKQPRKQPRKRGRRGGVRQRLRRRCSRPPLPSMILCNARSLRNKIDELRIMAKVCFEYRESCLLVVTETWLHTDISDSLIDLEGFSVVRADRGETSGKKCGGGIGVFINDRYCKNYTVRETVCNADVELLCLSLRPFYLPREFGNIIICSVYVPPSGNAAWAAARIADCVHNQLQRTPGAPVFILGDFNQCKLELSLPGFEQYIKCSTRGDKVLDKCYGNIKNAYRARSKPPLSNSDHNTVHLMPTYKTVFKSSKPQTKSIYEWSHDNIETLKGSFLCTNWDIFHDLDIDEAAETITDYILFCVSCVVTKKVVTVYPNNKPYITGEIKDCIKRKQLAFKNKDWMRVKAVQKELNHMLREARRKHKDIIEQNFTSMNSKTLWDSMKAATNMSTRPKRLMINNELEMANELNDFFLRFDKHDLSSECNNVLQSIITTDAYPKIVVDPLKIQAIFNQVCKRKSTGPDGISALLLKTFAEELTPAWCPIFQSSIDFHKVPAIWKKSTIIPIPKKSCPKENNDYRPVALTPIVMKCFEKYMVTKLKAEIGPKLDPQQFAYRQGRGTDDAITGITHLALKHLEAPGAYARLLFIDFSSAFNSLQPYLLIKKMNQMSVSPSIIKWFHSFLTQRTQNVRVNSTFSDSKVISTGAPQGCVSSPVLFTLYTNDCISSHSENTIFKFSDDTAILSLQHQHTAPSSYFSEVQSFVRWCDENHLTINTKKTEEMVLDPKAIGDHTPLCIHGGTINQVSSYRYLGVHLDDCFSWQVHVDYLCGRLQQRLYFLRRLRVFGVNQRVMFLFYQAVLESILRYGMSAWYGNLSVQLKSKIGRLIQSAMKVMGRSEKLPMQSIYEQSVLRQAEKILSDQTHILHTEYQLLPSGRRFRVPTCRLNRFRNSFVPTSIKILNAPRTKQTVQLYY